MSDEPSKLLQQLRLRPEERDSVGVGRRGWGWRVGIIAVAAMVLAPAAFFVLRARPLEVQTAIAASPAASKGPTAILQATGYVTARREATVAAQVTGTLTQVLIDEGEHVQAGQLLARLEDSSQRATLAQAQAQLAAAGALSTQYQTQLDQARRDLARNQELIARKLVSQQALELAQTQVDSLQAQLQVQQKQAELARAGVQGAEVSLGYTTIRAPFAGVVIAKAAQAGEIISPISAGGGFTRTGICTIVDMDSLEVEVDVNEAFIHRVLPQQSAQAVLDAYPDWVIPAHVIAIVPTADRSKATVKVRIGLDQKDPRVLPDMGVRVSFLESAPTASGPSPAAAADVLVPADAIADRAGGSVVFVVDGARARQRAVTPGQSFGDLRAVTGVDAGTRVVRDPPAGMSDNARIVAR